MYYLCSPLSPRAGIKGRNQPMKGQKDVRISNWAAHLTTGVSVTLALLMIGLIAMIWVAASGESRKIKEKIELSVVMDDTTDDTRALAILDAIEKQPFTLTAKYISSREALAAWKAATGEDLERTFGVNPLSPEIAFTVRSEYASRQAIAKITKSVAAIDGVAEVGAPDSALIDAMNRNIRRLTIGLTILAVIMFVISFVLIGNTVRLSIYARRFTIHTMQLVGATDGFIRRPFVLSNACVGFIAGVISAGILAGLLALAPQAGLEGVQDSIGWGAMGIIAAGLAAAGALICSLAATLATTRHLRQDYEQLFS